MSYIQDLEKVEFRAQHAGGELQEAKNRLGDLYSAVAERRLRDPEAKRQRDRLMKELRKLSNELTSVQIKIPDVVKVPSKLFHELTTEEQRGKKQGFSSTDDALQYLADVTGRRVRVRD